ncbi:metalloregulator ArsR/SmtB family transcription factor [Microbacterium sp. NPDC077184]|uniref:ArsR/SmtB family transcription factor n=1 Tax=Microbacterium sp. NPDC077184 TaxID=3154764 RepID=UPI003438E21B
MGDLYHALSDQTRRLILDELTTQDGQSLFELCSRLAMRHGITSSRQAISQHLGVLEDAGLVSSERVGRTRIHHLHTAPLREIIERWPAPGKD